MADKNSDRGASMASKGKSIVEPETVPTWTPEEFRKFKLQEALNERSKIDKLRRDAEERWKEERKTYKTNL